MDARRQHRIIYQTKIRMRAPGRDDSVIARVQNLSANGMFVTASDLPDAGTEVQCRLTLGGERRTLRGRVAWVRPASPATPLKSPGAGIEFIELDKRDSELLNRLVDPTDERRQAVDVWFEGMATPIRCQAVVVGDGLRLETRLPFMRVNSEVRVAFSQQTPAEVREGILHGVTLEPSPEDGVPFLRIGVTVPPLDSAIGTIEIAAREALRPEDQKTPLASTMVDPAVAGASPRVAFGADRERTHKISLTDPAPPPGPMTMMSAAPAAMTTPAGRPLPVPASGSGGARTLITGLLLGAALAGAAMWAWTHRTQLSPPTVSLVVAEPPPSQAAPSKDPTAAPAAPAAAADPGDPSVPAAAAADPAAAEVPGPEIVPLLAGETPAGAEAGAAEQPDGMALETSEGRVTFTVALEGKAAGAKEIRYGDPGGVGVTLPRARPKGGFGTFTPGAGPVRVMSRRRGSGSLVRFFYDGRAFQGKLAVESEMLRLVLAPR
jgi:hypothetical protein